MPHYGQRTRPEVTCPSGSSYPANRRTTNECRTGRENSYAGFGDLIRCYYAIGPRTGELAAILVKDVSLRKAQVVLMHHKRSKTMAEARPRVLTLNGDALEIFKRRCQGTSPDDLVFTQHNGRAPPRLPRLSAREQVGRYRNRQRMQPSSVLQFDFTT